MTPVRAKPAVTAEEIRPELAKLGRRNALLRGLSLGSLGLLTGCDLTTHSGLDSALWAMLRFNDRVQAALFLPLAPGGHLPGQRHLRSVPLQRLLRNLAGAGRPGRLAALGWWPRGG